MTTLKLTRIFNAGYTVAMLLISLLIGISIPFLFTAGIISNETYFSIYGLLGVLAIVGFGLMVLYHVFDTIRQSPLEAAVASKLFVADTAPERILSNPLARIGSVLALILFLVLATVLSPQSLVDVPNPYAAGTVTQTVLDAHPLLTNLHTVAIIPGFFEEAAIFFLTNALILTLTGILLLFGLKSLTKNLIIFLLLVTISVTATSLLFSVGHHLAYGGNLAASVSAFFFSWLVQFVNQLTGLFLSWIPHFLHNTIVIVKLQSGFVIGGAFLTTQAPALALASNSLAAFFRDTTRALRRDWRRLRAVVAA